MQVHKNDKDIEKIILKIKGMTCSNCELKIENSLNKLSGIESANVCLSDESAEINYDKNKISKEKITEIIEKLGYKAAGNDSSAGKKKYFPFFNLQL